MLKIRSLKRLQMAAWLASLMSVGMDVSPAAAHPPDPTNCLSCHQARQDAAALRGSRAALEAENAAADSAKLHRYAHSEELRRAIEVGVLVRLQDTDGYYLDAKLGEFGVEERELYTYVRPWTKEFLDDTAEELATYLAGRGSPDERFKIPSAVRTVCYQELVKLQYQNAAPGESDSTQSSHLTGATVDISTKGMSLHVLRWFRHRLASLERRGLVLATEERGRGGTAERPSSTCFHVMVLPAYARR